MSRGTNKRYAETRQFDHQIDHQLDQRLDHQMFHNQITSGTTIPIEKVGSWSYDEL